MPKEKASRDPAGLDENSWKKLFGVIFNVANDVADGLKLLSLFIRNVDAEFFLKRHDELDGVERVGTEVFDELGLGGDLFGVHAELFNDDVFDLVLDVVCHVCGGW
mgnify:CR=1 FL=1